MLLRSEGLVFSHLCENSQPLSVNTSSIPSTQSLLLELLLGHVDLTIPQCLPSSFFDKKNSLLALCFILRKFFSALALSLLAVSSL